jgi:hypothetical protein
MRERQIWETTTHGVNDTPDQSDPSYFKGVGHLEWTVQSQKCLKMISIDDRAPNSTDRERQITDGR